ncbi:MAG: hypothetical protein LBE08_07885 [Bifidobacteriaceae bacterium]|nr:hypothetical protein [Bifidobacteriaceae bacterium]
MAQRSVTASLGPAGGLGAACGRVKDVAGQGSQLTPGVLPAAGVAEHDH